MSARIQTPEARKRAVPQTKKPESLPHVEHVIVVMVHVDAEILGPRRGSCVSTRLATTSATCSLVPGHTGTHWRNIEEMLGPGCHAPGT